MRLQQNVEAYIVHQIKSTIYTAVPLHIFKGAHSKKAVIHFLSLSMSTVFTVPALTTVQLHY
jgi:hypothetical protein